MQSTHMWGVLPAKIPTNPLLLGRPRQLGHYSHRHLCGSRRVGMDLPNVVSPSPVSKSEFCETQSHGIIKTKRALLQICIVCHPLRQHPHSMTFCVLTFIELTSFDNITSFPNSCYVFWNSALHTGYLDISLLHYIHTNWTFSKSLLLKVS